MEQARQTVENTVASSKYLATRKNKFPNLDTGYWHLATIFSNLNPQRLKHLQSKCSPEQFLKKIVLGNTVINRFVYEKVRLIGGSAEEAE